MDEAEIKLTLRQKLILLLISNNLDSEFRLIRLLDTADFPSELGENLKVLLDHNLISVSELAYNGTPLKYSTTKKGEESLRINNYHQEIIGYVKSMPNPEFLLKLVQIIINKER